MTMTRPLPLAICCGDPCGVGAELIPRVLKGERTDDLVLIGPSRWLDTLSVEQSVSVGSAKATFTLGQPNLESAQVALEALKVGALGCLENRWRGLVTAALHKARCQQVDSTFLGQTEYLEKYWGGQGVMSFVAEKLKIVLVTRHLPLQAVGEALNETNLSWAVEQAAYLVESLTGKKEPLIGVCGLNPHAGEAGLMGWEEKNKLNVWLKKLQKKFGGLSLCQSPDTIFYRHLQGEFDSVVALYHDQGLIPIKTLEFEKAVHVTLGLPFMRFGPSGGTAFHLAGQQKASCQSLQRAISLARQLSR